MRKKIDKGLEGERKRKNKAQQKDTARERKILSRQQKNSSSVFPFSSFSVEETQQWRRPKNRKAIELN